MQNYHYSWVSSLSQNDRRFLEIFPAIDNDQARSIANTIRELKKDISKEEIWAEELKKYKKNGELGKRNLIYKG